MSELDELRAAVKLLAQKVQTLEDEHEIRQIVAQYGPAVDSGSGEAAAALWTEDGIFDAIPQRRMRGREQIVGMVHGAGHQGLILNGCGHVLSVPHIVIDGDTATGRSYALNIRWDASSDRFWVARVSANSWRWVRTPKGWRIQERLNANLDGTAEHRAMLAPSDAAPDTTPARATSRIGFIGAGRMGRPVVDRLVAAGHDVRVLVRRPGAQAAPDQHAQRAADTIAATVRDADLVFVAVFNDEQVRSVCLGDEGALASMKRGATLIVHTTCDPATAELVADAATAHGIRVLDAPFSGGPHDIAAGAVTLWVGGPQATLDELRPVLASYASPVLFVGPIGHGQRVKLVNNALFVAQAGLAVDAVRLAGQLGIEEQTILTALQHGSGASRALGIVARGGSVHAAAARLSEFMQKDVDKVRDVAARTRVELGIIGTVLSSDAVEKTILHPTTPDAHPTRR
jgi:3-hydroxyisobutyrate dehydrogenase